MLTLAIPYYSQPRYLEETLRSVQVQSDPDWKLILVDNSPEGGEAEAALRRVFPDGDPRVRLVRNPSVLPMALNWNRCLELAETDWVALTHSDDRLLPDYVGRMKRAALEYPDAWALYCKSRIIDETGAPMFSWVDRVKKVFEPRNALRGLTGGVIVSGDAGLAALLRGNFIMCPTLCYRKGVSELKFSERWGMVLDLDLTTRLVLAGGSIRGIPDELYEYRRHRQNATSQYNLGTHRFSEEFALYRDLLPRIRARGWDEALSVARSYGVVRIHLAFRTLIDIFGLRFRAAAAKAALLVRSYGGAS